MSTESDAQYAEKAQPEEGQQITAGDLGREHHGWLLTYPLKPDPRFPFSGPSRRTITLIGVRRWTYEDVARVGLLADESGPFRGTEYHLLADTPVTLQRHIRRGVPRPRKNDYPEAAHHA